jgi:hypothetical protein
MAAEFRTVCEFMHISDRVSYGYVPLTVEGTTGSLSGRRGNQESESYSVTEAIGQAQIFIRNIDLSGGRRLETLISTTAGCKNINTWLLQMGKPLPSVG